MTVWIEDAAGNLVETVALWHEERGGQDRRLCEMTGSTLDGGRATAGTDGLFDEAAREHGPYELVQSDVPGTKSASFDLTPSGELTAASAR